MMEKKSLVIQYFAYPMEETLVNKGLFASYYSVAYLLGMPVRGRIKEVWGKYVL